MSKKIIVCVLLAILLVTGIAGSSPAKADDQVQTVRVGWFQSDMFQEGMDDASEKSGYCYDYLQTISNYTSWRYEYVYGEWTELVHMLENGEIDFMAGMSYTEERSELMLFPDDAMGNDQYYMYKHADDDSINSYDLTTLNGKKVGGITDNRTSVLTKEWIEANNVDLEMVYFDSFDDLEQAFNNGEVDLFSQTIYNVLSMEDISLVAKVGEEPFYLAVSKDREDLLDEMNAVMAVILSTNPFILQNLQYENYGITLTGRTMTEQEQKWVEEHPHITIGYLDDYLPYSDTDENGDATGVMTDAVQAVGEALGLSESMTVSYKAYTSYSDMVQALKNREVDVVFPVMENLWQLEQDGINASSSLLTSTETIYFKGIYQKDQIETIAVNENNEMQISYCKRNFPDAELVYFTSIKACLEAVVDGKVDATVMNTMRAAIASGSSRYDSLSTMQLPGTEGRCFGVNEGDARLLMILNRGLGLLGDSFGTDHSYKYTAELSTYTTIDFLRDHMVNVTVVLLMVVAIIIALLVWNIRKQTNAVRQKEKYIREMDAVNKQLERLRQEAEDANDAKTSFLFNMSHDIRTPMNAIIGFRDLLEKNQDDPEKRADYLKKIKEASDVLLSIINNVLEMARIEKGTIELVENAWAAEQFNDTLYSVFNEMMAEKGITFTRHINVQNQYVYCDSTKLREVFINILSNAYKYTNAGGSVTMDLEEIPSGREGVALYRTTVTDTGIGMSEDFLPHIFEEFSRENNTTANKIEGTGLGMPIVKRLVELMNGTIDVTSKKGVGTTFVVTMPHRIAKKSDLTSVTKDTAGPADFTGKRILLAEDNEFNAEIAVEILKAAGLSVEVAENGRVACERLKEKEAGYYDLILMDIQMPEMNGYEATRAIRSMDDKEKADIPIIAMTANAFEEDKREAAAAGMNGHLAKPIDVKALFKTLSSKIG